MSSIMSEKFLTKIIPLILVGILLYIFLTKGVIIALYATGLFIIGYFILSSLYRVIVRTKTGGKNKY